MPVVDVPSISRTKSPRQPGPVGGAAIDGTDNRELFDVWRSLHRNPNADELLVDALLKLPIEIRTVVVRVIVQLIDHAAHRVFEQLARLDFFHVIVLDDVHRQREGGGKPVACRLLVTGQRDDCRDDQRQAVSDRHEQFFPRIGRGSEFLVPSHGETRTGNVAAFRRRIA